MVDSIITKQELIDAQKDAQSLDDFINGGDEQIVVTRLLNEYPTLANAIRQIYEKGGKFYPTLAAANADIANIRAYVYVITGDNGAYYKATAGATTLTQSPYDPLTQAKADATTKAENAKFGAISQIISASSNLYNDATSAKVDKVISSTGELVDSAGFAYSEFISVLNNTDYYQDGFRHVAFYDSNKTFISRQSYSVVSSKVSGSFKTPVNTAFIRLSYRYDILESNAIGRILNVGTSPVNYEPFYKKLGLGIEVEKITKAKEDLLAEILVTKDSITKASSNLFDKSTIKKGKVINLSGLIVDNVDFAYSDFIKVDKSQDYYFDGFRSVAFYDVDKNFINRIDIAVSNSKYAGVISTDAKTQFIRVNLHLTANDTIDVFGRKINKGAVAQQYEAYFNRPSPSLIIPNVKPTELNSIQLSKNLFNHNAVTSGKAILSTGVIADNASYAITDFIAVDANSNYTISSEVGTSAFTAVAYYDADKSFIERVDVNSASNAVVVLTPTNAFYVRFNINTALGSPSQRQRMFNKGSVALNYEPYANPILSGVTLAQDIKDQIQVNNEHIAQSANLFDHTKATIGYAILATGAVSENANYSYSDYIKVESGQKYTMSAESGYNAFINTAYYDESKTFINRVDTLTPSGPLTITIPAGVSYVRFNINAGLPSQRNRMFNKGDTALPYVPYRVELSGVTLAGDVMEQLSKELQLDPDDNVMLDLPVDAVYSTNQTWPFITDFRNVTSAQVYQMFDTLMSEHPNYITKQVLGNDAWGNPIAVYKFTPTKPTATAKTRYPKVFLTCGTHGMEHTPPMATYLMLYEMCKNWQSNPLLEALRFNVNFLILPVVNPSGWNKYSRVNDNGVDINRNFPEGWSLQGEGTDLYGGPSPLSELESQYVKQVFDENPNIDIMYDYHNFNGLPGWEHVIWVPTGSGAYVEHMCQMLVGRMTRKWRKEYSFIPTSETWFAGYSDTTHGAMIQDHARERGIKFSATFETAGKIWLDPEGGLYNTPHKKMCVEALVNWILINLNEVKRI